MALESEGITLDGSIAFRGARGVWENPNRGKYYIGEINEKPVASLLITYEWSDWRAVNIWWIQSVYVLPDFRRQGVFTAFYQEIRSLAAKAGAPYLRLYVDKKNQNAIARYKKLGLTDAHYFLFEESLID